MSGVHVVVSGGKVWLFESMVEAMIEAAKHYPSKVEWVEFGDAVEVRPSISEDEWDELDADLDAVHERIDTLSRKYNALAVEVRRLIGPQS